MRYLSAEERDRLLSGVDVTTTASDGRTWTVRRKPNVRLRRYILAALHTGARLGDLAALTWADVDFKARSVRFLHTKNGHARTMPIPTRCAKCCWACRVHWIRAPACCRSTIDSSLAGPSRVSVRPSA